MSINNLVSTVQVDTTQHPQLATSTPATPPRRYVPQVATDTDEAAPVDVLRAVQLSKEMQAIEEQQADAYWNRRNLAALQAYGWAVPADKIALVDGLLLACKLSYDGREWEYNNILDEYPAWREWAERASMSTEEWRAIEQAQVRLRLRRAMARGAEAFGMTTAPITVSGGESTSDTDAAAEFAQDQDTARYAGVWF